MKLPDGLQADAATYKGREVNGRVVAEVIPPSSLIQIQDATNFASMKTVDDLENAKMRNPAAGWHEAVRRAFQWQNDDPQGLFEAKVTTLAKSRKVGNIQAFVPGTRVKDIKHRRKGIIIQANAGYTKKRKRPVHLVVDREGDAWYAKQSDLKCLD